jgi:hypothetical protein
MKAALKAINEDKPEALATAIDSLEDVNAVCFLFLVFLLFFRETTSLSCCGEGLDCAFDRPAGEGR